MNETYAVNNDAAKEMKRNAMTASSKRIAPEIREVILLSSTRYQDKSEVVRMQKNEGKAI